ncbi:hypothetical protein K2173_027017 [Erythroxylum novogranatense]|uniref:Uncharacterized protein n=1 Tax=Erythroxylum novogranatense TaxID=1862640 RepID=A0AAV8U195_9ROSI|nr:hypothetical protein K2173_027017 [Erythroxylum novogranatense]
MGLVSRKIFPACESMCICCPALRSRSRQPVKRYKKLLSEIFPKSPDGTVNERKIVKLCEYAAKNPLRIPKIAKYLEERCYKELRSGQVKFINIVAEAYNKMVSICKEQMAYFAINLLNVVNELLDKSKQEACLILGCHTLTTFIYSQADGTYTHTIEKFVQKVCKLARENGEKHHTSRLKAYSLQCLSAMVWYMTEFSYIFAAFDEIVHAMLDNYEPELHVENNDGREEPQHNWVDEVVRCEGRTPVVDTDANSSCILMRQQTKKIDPSQLTREEFETPRVWAQVCIQRMVELAKERTTMRRVLDPMFNYFDSGRHWVPRQGLAMIVMSDLCYFLETSGDQQLVLAAVIRHLDHKNIAHDPQLKSHVIQLAAALARQIRSEAVLVEISIVSDLCRHLRKSLQATVESAGDQESNLNISLQNSIEFCLLEIAKGIGDTRPLFDMMAITLEKLASAGVVARPTIGSLIVLAHVISLSSPSLSLQVFPEELLIQLLKVMVHPDLEVRVGAHRIFSILLMPSSSQLQREASLQLGSICELRKWHSDTASAFASITSLLERLRREKDGKIERHGKNVHGEYKELESMDEDWKQCLTRKNSSNFYSINSIIDRTAVTSSFSEGELHVVKLNEDQIGQLLSAFWVQANLSDNMPSNFEAIAHSFVLTVVSSRLKNTNDLLVVRFFQLLLSLANLALDSNNGTLTPACKRSIFGLSIGMLMSAAKIYQVAELNEFIKSLLPSNLDPFLAIGTNFQVHVKPFTDIGEYGSVTDNQLAMASIRELQRLFESNKGIIDLLALNLSKTVELGVDELARQLSEPFVPDEAFMFGPQLVLDIDHSKVVSHSKESLSFDDDALTSLVQDDVTSEASVADLSRFIPKMPSSPSVSHIISIGQLLESALEVAGQVVGTSVSTSPLPYDTMAKQCEALGTGTRKKLSNWLVQENCHARAADKVLLAHPTNGCPVPLKGSVRPMDSSLAMRLPPASPFDNFLKAAGC